MQVIALFQRKKDQNQPRSLHLSMALKKKYHAPPILGTRSSFKLDLYDYIKVTYVFIYLLNGF